MGYIATTMSNLLHQTAFLNLTWGNYVMMLVAFVFLYLPVARDTRASMKLVMLLLVALIYWVSMALYWVVSTLFRKAAPEPKPEYKSVFKK